ncbi:MAG: CHAP domain-containing protein [Bacteroidetes bacterium]|nr:CHAP domain-containing protein [Bacteroidota bacterium]
MAIFKRSVWFTVIVILMPLGLGYVAIRYVNLNPKHEVGQPVDSLNGVKVYFNGGIGNVTGRNLTPDGYNLGLKYQCVEFVKRYYYEHLRHKMPNAYGHAKDFFHEGIADGQLNKQRNLLQFTNPSMHAPEVNDLLVYGPNIANGYGHVAIVSKVEASRIEIVQQNPGPFSKSRIWIDLERYKGQYTLKGGIIGWLRKE